tara:strand:- start:347 stop:862 length:516 start_codon:yes stop_codon:yes gene_type:complete
MFVPHSLRVLAFPERFAVWGLPAAWWVVFVQSVSPFLSVLSVTLFVCVYVGLVALWGTLRPLTFPKDVRDRLNLRNTCKESFVAQGVRAANTLCDASCAALSLFFLSKITVLQPLWFPPLFIFAVATHCFVEYYVGTLLGGLHLKRNETFGGRQFQPEEIEQLVTVEAVAS